MSSCRCGASNHHPAPAMNRRGRRRYFRPKDIGRHSLCNGNDIIKIAIDDAATTIGETTRRCDGRDKFCLLHVSFDAPAIRGLKHYNIASEYLFLSRPLAVTPRRRIIGSYIPSYGWASACRPSYSGKLGRHHAARFIFTSITRRRISRGAECH